MNKKYKPRLNNYNACILFIQRKIHQMDEVAVTGADRGRVLDAMKVLHLFMQTKDLNRIEEKFDELKRLRKQSNLPWGEDDEQKVEEFLAANRK